MNEHRTIVETSTAPRPVGPYSQAIKSGNQVFLSMQIALDPQTGQLVGGDTAAQAERTLKNVEAILEAVGSAIARVVRVGVYYVDPGDMAAVNKVYAEHFNFEPPARTAVQVAGLPLGARVGIDVVATCKSEDNQFGASRF